MAKQIPTIRNIDQELVRILEPMKQRIEGMDSLVSVENLRPIILKVVRGSGVLRETPVTPVDTQPFFDALAELTRRAQEQVASLQDPIRVNQDMAFDALSQAQRSASDISAIADDLADQADELAQQALDILDLATDVTVLQTSVGDLEDDVLATSTLLTATVSRVDANEDSIDVITAAITSLSAETIGDLDPAIIWQFEGSLDGWTSNFTLSTGSFFVSVPDDSGTYLRSPAGIATDGNLYRRIVARIRRTSGTGWLGRASYATSGGSAHGIDTTNFHLTLATEPIFAGGGWVIVVWDMDLLTAGGTDWVDNIIDQIQLELSDDAATEFDVDWVAIGRVAPSFFAGSLSALTSRVTATEDAIDVLSSDVTSLESRATDLEGDVDANSTAISTLSTRVTATEDSIDVNSADIVSLESRVDDAEGDITATSTALSALTTRVTATENAIDLQATDITDLELRLTDAEGDIEAGADATEALDTRITSAEGVNTTQSTAITNLQTTVNHPTTGVAATASALTTLTGRVTTAEGSITTQAGQITSINSAINDAETGLSANASAISSVQTQVTALGDTVTLTSQKVDGVSVRLSDGDSLINPLTTPGVNADWDVPAFGILPTTDIFQINIGGRNRSAARLRTSTNGLQRSSRMIEVDHGSIYEIRFSVLKATANGRMYVGLTASTDGVTQDNAQVTPIIARALSGGPLSNPYFFFVGGTGANGNFSANKWYDIVAYVCGSDAPVNRVPNISVNGFRPPSESVPTLTSPTVRDGFQLPSTARFFNVRALNADNSVQVDMHVNNVSVRRIFARDAGIDQEIADRQAAVLTEQNARIAGDAAVASSVTTVSTQVGANSASISSLQSSVNGLNAQFVLQLNVNGRITGLKLAGSPTFTAAVFQVDQFSIALPGASTPVVPFTVGTVNGVPTVGINGNLVVDGTIVTNKLVTGGVTTEKMAPNSISRFDIQTGITPAFAPSQSIQVCTSSLTIGNATSVTRIDWICSINHSSSVDPAGRISVQFTVTRNGGVITTRVHGLNSRNFTGEVYPGYTRTETYNQAFNPGDVITATITVTTGPTAVNNAFSVTRSFIQIEEKMR